MFNSLPLGHPPGFSNVWIVWYGEIAPEGTPYGNDTAEDEEPPPASQSGRAIHPTVDSRLEVSAEHAGCITSRIENGDAFTKF